MNAARVIGAAGFPRRVEAELLDELPADDPRAVRSRRDLRRVNRLMGNAPILLRAMESLVEGGAAPHFVELGAGDGSLMLRIARRSADRWRGARLTLVDLQRVVDVATLADFHDVGWRVDVVSMDVFEWLASSRTERPELVVANLFVHHFEGERLERLLQGIAQRAQAFACLEPRRSRAALIGSHLLGAVGCNAITRHDAVLSVHAGFRDSELGALWPSAGECAWETRESRAGPFGHLFTAKGTP